MRRKHAGSVARTATQALTNVTYRYVELLADLGLEGACKKQPALIGGINTRDGRLTCKAVAEAHGLKLEPPFSARGEPFVFPTRFCVVQKLRLLRLIN